MKEVGEREGEGEAWDDILQTSVASRDPGSREHRNLQYNPKEFLLYRYVELGPTAIIASLLFCLT